jgi:hypothetical protein
MSYLNSICKSYDRGSKVVLVDTLKPTHEHDVHASIIVILDVYILFEILGVPVLVSSPFYVVRTWTMF